MAAVTVMCPNLGCRTFLRVPESVRGKKVRCGVCGLVFAVPGKGSSEQSPSANPPTAQPAK